MRFFSHVRAALALVILPALLRAGEEPLVARPGFPRHISSSVDFGEVRGQARIGDIDGDGNREIVFGALDGLVHLFDAGGDEIRTGLWPAHTGGPILAPVALAPLPDQGGLLVAASSADGSVYVFGPDGDLRWKRAVGNLAPFAPRMVPPDQEGEDPRVLVAASGGRLLLLAGAGDPVWETRLRSDVAGDLLSVATGEGSTVLAPLSDGRFQLVDPGGEPGAPWPGPGPLPDSGPARVTVTDLDQDLVPDLITVLPRSALEAVSRRSPGFVPGGTPGTHEVLVLDPGGHVARSFPITGDPIGNISAADLDRDGVQDLLWVDQGASAHATGQGGETLPGWPVRLEDRWTPGSHPPRIVPVDGILVHDMDGDDSPDILVPVRATTGEGATGAIIGLTAGGDRLAGYPVIVGQTLSRPTVSDLEDDGLLELIAPGGAAGTGPHLHAFSTPASPRVRSTVIEAHETTTFRPGPPGRSSREEP